MFDGEGMNELFDEVAAEIDEEERRGEAAREEAREREREDAGSRARGGRSRGGGLIF